MCVWIKYPNQQVRSAVYAKAVQNQDVHENDMRFNQYIAELNCIQLTYDRLFFPFNSEEKNFVINKQGMRVQNNTQHDYMRARSMKCMNMRVLHTFILLDLYHVHFAQYQCVCVPKARALYLDFVI